MNADALIKVTIDIESIKATPRIGMTLDDLAEKMKQIGNEVIEINREENYLLLKNK